MPDPEELIANEDAANSTEDQIENEEDAVEAALGQVDAMQELMDSWEGEAATNAKASATCIRMRMVDAIDNSGRCGRWCVESVEAYQEIDEEIARGY